MNNQQVSDTHQAMPVYTKVEVTLAALLGTCIYIVLWTVGMLLGIILSLYAVVFLTLTVFFLRTKVPSRTLRILATDISVILLVVLVIQLAVEHFGLTALPLISTVVGGAIMGIIRREFFQPYMKKKLIKYCFSPLIVLSVPVLVFVLGVMYGMFTSIIDIPVSALHLPKVAEGWYLGGEEQLLRVTKVTYNKDESSLIIHASRLPGPPWTREECKRVVEIGTKLQGLGSPTVKLSREETVEIHGKPLYVFRYGTSTDGDKYIFLAFFWYCDNVESNVYTIANINDSPSQKYINEVEDMVYSFECPK